MSSINWEEIENKYSFRQVEDGEYTTQVVKAEVADTPSPSGSYAINFELKDLNGVKFPYSSTHWISFKNNNWRIYHMKSLLLDMSVDEAKAKKKVEECESAGSNEQIADAYRKMFKACASTSPKTKVKVETQPYIFTNKETQEKTIHLNGHRTEFAGESYMPPQTVENLQERYPGVPVEGGKVENVDDLGGVEDSSIDMGDIPF